MPATNRFGLYDAADFQLADGRCRNTATSRQALWYFEHETIALPLRGRATAGFSPWVRTIDDVRAWSTRADAAAALAYPPLVWVGAPLTADRVAIDASAGACRLEDGTTRTLRLVPKIAANRSYFDASSARFFADRATRIRGSLEGDTLVARTLWPEDFRLDAAPPLRPLEGTPATLGLRALVRSQAASFDAALLWQRAGLARPPFAPGRPVLALVLNGAQGDDDEAHGGHFALATGSTRADGGIDDWMVNNFYSLDVVSEKGILAAPLPLDNYLGDLNSGQNWYRPSYLLVAALASDRAAALVQGALNRVYNQFYRHQTVYRHATMNCAGISVDVLRALGWPVSVRGPESPLLGVLAFPYFLARDRSLDKARGASDYLLEDPTRLFPAVTFEQAGADLIALAARGSAAPNGGLLAEMLAADVDAIAFVRLPQFPSSRAAGGPPVISTRDYQTRLPSDRGKMQIIPLPPRPFPAALRDPDLLRAPWVPSDWIAIGWSLFAIVLAALAVAAFQN